MTSITEILGGAQQLLDISYDLQSVFEDYLTKDHRAFLHMLRVLEEDAPRMESCHYGRGRPAFHKLPFLRAFLGKSFFKLDSFEDLIDRLGNDGAFRKICGFESVPSPATFSRRFAEFAEKAIADVIHNGTVRRHLSGKIIGHISRDSTAIEAREKPMNQKRDVKEKPKPKKKRGRPRKGEEPAIKEKTRLERQIGQKPGKSLSQLNLNCSWGCKRNSQGNVDYWRGYKLHMDVTDMGIPVTAVVTGANVHDSQVAIPMEKWTERKVTFLYSLMDSAYDAAPIHSYIAARGRVPIIDPNKRRNEDGRTLDPAEKKRYNIRTVSERANAHLKDWFFGTKIIVRGSKKVRLQLMCGVLCLTAVKILQYLILPSLESEAA